MIHISHEELLSQIEQERKQLLQRELTGSTSGLSSSVGDMSSILPTTYGAFKDTNNNSLEGKDEDEVQAVLVTGN